MFRTRKMLHFVIAAILLYYRVKTPPRQAIHYLREYHCTRIQCSLFLRVDYTINLSSNQKEPILDVSSYFTRCYTPSSSKHPDSSDMCSVLDGFSRYIVHWEIRKQMTEMDIEIILQRAHERFPQAKPRVISDNGPQFISKDFKDYIRLSGMTHVRTSPYYPQSNGKLERYHKTIKSTCIRVKTPLSLEDARVTVADFVAHYNNNRLHSAIGYVTPNDKLQGRAEIIYAQRDVKLAAARAARKAKRQAS